MTLPPTVTCFSCRHSKGGLSQVPGDLFDTIVLFCTRDGQEAKKLCAYYEREPGADEPEP